MSIISNIVNAHKQEYHSSENKKKMDLIILYIRLEIFFFNLNKSVRDNSYKNMYINTNIIKYTGNSFWVIHIVLALNRSFNNLDVWHGLVLFDFGNSCNT